MRFAIWQCPIEQTLGGFKGYHPELDYSCVWESHVDEVIHDYTADAIEGLEVIFASFQWVDEERMPPSDYKGRSLSAGDLVCLDERWYFCALEGWKHVTPPLAALGSQKGTN